MNRYALLVFCVLLALGCSQGNRFPRPEGTVTIPEGFPGVVDFTTEGIEVDGVLHRLKGVNLVDPIAQATWNLPKEVGPFDKSYYEEARRWGAQILRVPIHPEFWRADPALGLTIVRQAVDWSAEVGLYVILDFHGIGMMHLDRYEEAATSTTREEFLAFWQDLSLELQNDENIAAFSVFNEPVNLDAPEPGSDADWQAWKADAEAGIDVIRGNDPDRWVIVGGQHWAYDLSRAAADPIARDRVAYDAHIYPFTPDFKSWQEAVGQPAQTLPVFVGEWGWDVQGLYNEASFGEHGEYGQALVNFMDEHNLSWTAWVFSSVWDPRILANWDYDMTAYGAFVHEQMQLP